MSRNAENSISIHARSADRNSWGTAIVLTVLCIAAPWHGGSRMNEYADRVISYRTSMSMVTEMLNLGIITEKEYSDISQMLIEEYGLDPQTIFKKPLDSNLV